MTNDGNSFVGGILVVFCCVFVFSAGFAIGGVHGESAGEKNTAIITVNSLNRIQEQLPPGTKITNPFTDEDLKSLSYDAQKILRLFN